MKLHLDLQSHHQPTGNTRHVVGGELMAPPTALEIVSGGPGEAGYFLVYLDATGQAMTDTWHASLEDAQAQAEFEFGVRPAH
jgi:hypothetical protein